MDKVGQQNYGYQGYSNPASQRNQQPPVAGNQRNAGGAVPASQASQSSGNRNQIQRASIPPGKRIPYVSTSGKKTVRTQSGYQQLRLARTSANYNGELSVADGEGSHLGNVIQCRHLALTYASQPKMIDRFALGPAEIKKCFSGNGLRNAEAHFATWMATAAKNKQIVGNRQFGNWLALSVKEMVKNGKTDVSTLMTTPDHALAVRIQIKEGNKIRVTCYDPNVTARHTAFEASHPDELLSRSLLECFGDLHTQSISENPNAMTVTAVCPDLALSTSSRTNFLPDHHTQSAGDKMDTLSNSLYASMRNNIVDTMEPLARDIRQAGYTGEKALDIFARGEGSHGTQAPALFLAGQDGYTEVFSHVPELLRRLQVTGDEAVDVLHGSHNGYPIINSAARRGNAPLFASMTELLKEMRKSDRHFTVDHAVEVLQSIDAGETPAMSIAAEQGHVKMWPEVGKVLKSLKASQSQIVETLEGKDADATPALWIAIDNGHPQGYAEMAKAIQHSGMTDKQSMKNLLLAKDSDGLPAHHHAAEKHMPGAFMGLADALISLGIRGAEAQSVLMGERQDGVKTPAMVHPRDTALQQEFMAAFKKVA